MAGIDRRTISLAGQSLKSDAWVAMGRVLFGSVQIKRNQEISLIPPAARFFRYCCDTCDNRFESAVTPEKCPACGALPGELGVTVTHHLRSNPDVTCIAKTFPFSLT